MVRIGAGQSGSDTGTDGGDDSTSDRQRRRDRRRETIIGDDGGGDSGGGSDDPANTPRERAVDQTPEPAPDPDGGADDPANTPRERAVDQTPAFADDPTRGTDISPGAGFGGSMDSGPAGGTTPIVTGVGSGSIEARQQLNRLTGPGIAAWEIEDRAGELEQRVADRTAADPSDIRIDLRPGVGLVPVFSEDFREEQREGREIDATMDRDTAIGSAAAEVSARRGRAFQEREQAISDVEQQIADQIGVPASVIDEGEDFTISDEGEVELTAEGRQTAIEAQAAEEGQVDLQPRGDEDNVFVDIARGGRLTEEQIAGIEERTDGELVFDDEGNVTGLQQSIDIQTTDQLTFDDEGTLVDVREFDETEAAEQAARQELESAVPLVGGPVSDFAFGSREFVGDVGDVSTDVGTALWEGGDIPGTDINVGLEAGAEVTGDVAGLAQESGEFVLFGGDENARDVRQSTFDIVRGEEDETTSNIAESVGENLALGAGDIVRAGVELPETVATGAEVTGRGAAFAYEDPTAAPGAAAGATAGLAEQLATQVIENPVRTTGALIGSAGIMGGAARLSPRAGLATRAAIQPGEELLGVGGFRATRAVGGEGAAQRLFPNQEPLIFSEEAAIRTGRQVGSGLRDVGGRVRGSLGELETPSIPFSSRVEVVKAPGDPLITYGYQGRSAFNMAGERVGRRAASRFGDADITAANVGERIGRGIGDTTAELPGQLSGTLRGAELSTEASVRDIGGRVQAGGERIGRRAGERAGELPSDIGDTIRGVEQQADVLRFDAMERLQTGGTRVGRGVAQRAEAVGDLPGEVSGTLRGAELSLEAGTRNVVGDIQTRGARTGRRVGERAGELPSDIGDTIRGVEQQADILRFDAMERLQTGGARVGSGVAGRGETVGYLPGEISGAIRGAELSAEAGVRETVGAVQEGGQRIGRRAGEAGRGVGERIGDFATSDTSITDYSIRIRPRPTTIEVEGRGDVTPDVETEGTPQPFDPPERFEQPGTAGGGQRIVATEGGTETGVAVQQVVEAPRFETEAPERTRVDGDRTPFRTDFVVGGVTEPSVDIGLIEEPTVGDVTSPIESVDIDDRVGVDTLTDIRTGIETRGEAEGEAETEAEAEAEREILQELETETETETELELELEQELEAEADQREREDERLRDGDVSADPFLEEFEYGVADPMEVLTGDRT